MVVTTGALEALARGESVVVACVGGSMFPVVRNGEHVVIEAVQGPLVVGDVCLASVGAGPAARWVLHRIIAIRGDALVLRGDNGLAADPPTTRAHVMGRATRVVGDRARPLVWPECVARAWIRVCPGLARLLRWRRAAGSARGHR